MTEATDPQTEPTPADLPEQPEIAGFDTPSDHKSGYITLVGRPNVGKSTLLNALLKQKIAIVSPRPQTTRQRQLGIITRPSYQMIFIDTPGMMRPRHKLDEFMMDSAIETLQDADVILWLVDGSERPGPGDEAIARQLKEAMAATPDVKVILGINKADLVAPKHVLLRTDAYRALLPDAPWIFFSATEGHGRDALYQMLVDALPPGPRYYPPDQITDAYIRDIAAELVREQIMLQLQDEVPYGTAVRVEEYKERDNGSAYISATIFVERDNHKPILIGAKGSQLRSLGKAARQEIEALIGNKVFLDLWVKVIPKWRKSDSALRRLGYSDDE